MRRLIGYSGDNQNKLGSLHAEEHRKPNLDSNR